MFNKSLKFIFLIFLSSCNISKNEDVNESYFNAIQVNDLALENPKKGDWLYENKESGQNFKQYKNANPVHPSRERNIIYLKPIGSFAPQQKVALNATREYVEIFFQLKTIILDSVNDNVIPKAARRTRQNSNDQLLAPYILDTILKNKIPPKGIALMAFAAKDLYPANDWNYVFGLASYSDRVGVSSIFRLQEKIIDTTSFRLCLRRLVNISSHEIGHMFTMAHCINAMCTMNGSNTMYETDLCPNRLCSECQQKLFWNIKYDNKKRLNQLVSFFKKYNLTRDLKLAEKDFKVVEEE